MLLTNEKDDLRKQYFNPVYLAKTRYENKNSRQRGLKNWVCELYKKPLNCKKHIFHTDEDMFNR